MLDIIIKTEAIQHIHNSSNIIATDLNNFYNSLPESAEIVSVSIMYPISYVTYKVLAIQSEDYFIEHIDTSEYVENNK